MSIELPDLVQVVRVNTQAMRDSQRDLDAFGKSFQEVQKRADEPTVVRTKVDDEGSTGKVKALRAEVAALDAQHADVEVDVDAELARQNVRRLQREIAAVQKRIDVDVDAHVDVSPTEYAKIAELRARLNSLDTHAKVDVDTRTAGSNVHNLARSLWDLKTASSVIPAVTRGLMVPGAVTAVTLLTSAVSSLAAGAVAVTGALAPASAGVVSFGQAAVSAMSAIKTFTFLTKDALKASADLAQAKRGTDEWREALDKIPKSARAFAIDVATLRKEINKVREAGQEAAFPGFRQAIAESGPLLAAFRVGVVGVSSELGDLAKRTARLTDSPVFSRNLATVVGTNTALVHDFGGATLALGRAMTTLGAAAAPLTLWLSDLARAGAENLAATLEQAQASGSLAGFFENAATVIASLGRTFRDFGMAMGDVFAGGMRLGGEFLAAMEQGAARFRAFTESARGENAIAQFFADARPVLVETGRLIGDIFQLFGKLATNADLAPVIEQVRTQLLPALGDLLGGTTRFGQSFVTMATAIVKAINMLSFSPLIEGVRVVSELVIAFTNLVGKVDGLSTVAATLITVGLALKSIAVIGKLTGLTSLVAILSGLTPAGNKAVGVLGSIAIGVRNVERPAQGANAAAVAFGAGISGLASSLHMSVGALAAWAGGITAAVVGLNMLQGALRPASPDVDKLTGSMLDFARSGQLGGEAARVLGEDFGALADAVSEVSGLSGWVEKWASRTSFGVIGDSLGEAKARVDALDKTLAGLVQAGYGDLAAQMFRQVAAGVAAQGGSVKDLKSQLNDYAAAQQQANNSTEAGLAAAGGYADAQRRAAAATNAAVAAINAEKQAIDDLNGVHQTEQQAAINVARAKQRAAEVSDGSRRVTLDERQSLLDLAQAYKDEATARDHGARGTERWMATLKAGNQAVYEAARNLGMGEKEARAFANSLVKIPKTKDIAIHTPGWKAANDIAEDTDDLLTRLGKKKVSPEVRADIRELKGKQAEAKALLDKLGRMKPTPEVRAAIAAAKARLKEIQKLLLELSGSTATVYVTAQDNFDAVQDRYVDMLNYMHAHPATTNTPGTKERAGGGDVAANTAYIVGERGPELFVPDVPGTVIPAGPTAAMIANSGKGTAAAAYAAGAALGEGLARGLAGAADTVVGAMRRLAVATHKAFTDYFGIASPSTIMEGVGADIMLGLVQGLTGTGMSEIMQAALQIQENLVTAVEQYGTERSELSGQLEDENLQLAQTIRDRARYIEDYKRETRDLRQSRREEDADVRRERAEQRRQWDEENASRQERQRQEAKWDREDAQRRKDRAEEDRRRAEDHKAAMAQYARDLSDARNAVATTRSLLAELDQLSSYFTDPSQRAALNTYITQQASELERLAGVYQDLSDQYQKAVSAWEQAVAEKEAFMRQVTTAAISFASIMNAFGDATDAARAAAAAKGQAEVDAAQAAVAEVERELAKAQEDITAAQRDLSAAQAVATAAEEAHSDALQILIADLNDGVTSASRLAAEQEAVDETARALAEANKGVADAQTAVNRAEDAAVAQQERLTKATEAAAAAQERMNQAQQDAVATAEDVAKYLEERLAALTQFAANIEILMARGLNPTTLRQIVEAGVEGAGELADALAHASDATIASINDTQGRINTVADQLGTSVASSFFDAGIAAARGLMEGLRVEMERVFQELFHLAKQMAETLNQALQIGSPSRVFMRIGRQTMEGLVAGLGQGEPDLAGATQRIAERLASGLVEVQVPRLAAGTRADLERPRWPTAAQAPTAVPGGGITFNGPVNVFDPDELADRITKRQRRAALLSAPA